MGVRDRLAQLRKVFGSATPGAIQAAEVAAGMGPTEPFSPGEPIGPYDGYSRVPRSRDFVTGYNIATRPRTHERISFETLKGLIEAYDVAQMCIWHRIDSIRSLDWSLVAAPHYDGDVTDAIRVGMAALKKPDRQTPFANWLSSYLYDTLAYDAGALYRLRNRGGRVIGLMNVDGTSIAPLLDYWGRSPEAPAEAYVQYAQGLPWNWLTRNDLVYEPFRRRPNSPYGIAPLETILLNANTDIRFQVYFLERFTEGNIPEAFASAPESWSPDQIEQFQGYWDSFMAGDQAAKHQIKWMPGGSSIAWSNEKDFTDSFSLHLMRKTAAAFHVVPADLGFTESVNRSSGESQADVQHRVGDLPLIRHVQGVLSSFLQDDLGLPLDFAFDLGEEQVDQLAQAQADQIYIQMGAISSSEVREMRYGRPEPEGVPVPRFIYTSRSGPIPLSALYGVSGKIDPATGAPAPDAALPHTVFTGVEGTQPNPPLINEPLAEQIYGPSAVPPGAEPVGKEAAGGAPPTAGITSETGITSYDLVGHQAEDDEAEDEDQQELIKRELAAFRSFRKARRRQGQWRDFEFRHLDPAVARQLNHDGRASVHKATTVPKVQAPDKGANHWPGWQLDEACAEYWAQRVADACAGALTARQAEQLATDYQAQRPASDSDQDKSTLVEAALAWLTTQGLDLTTPIGTVLTGLYTDAYLIGITSAHAAIDNNSPQIGAWKPGDTTTATVIIDSLDAGDGLAELLDEVPDAARSIADGHLRDLARELVTGTSTDTSTVTKSRLGNTLRSKLADIGRATTTAITAITRGSGIAALFGYRQRQVDMGQWLIDPGGNVCPTCQANADVGLVPVGQPYPSGDTCPPAHPNCRCAVVPA